MRLVIDANIIFAALISPAGKTASIIMLEDHELLAPAFIIDEILEHKEEICRKSKISPLELEQSIGLLFSHITIMTPVSIPANLRESCPDKDDLPYLALALQQGCSLWSDDKRLRSIREINIITTQEMASSKPTSKSI